MILSVRALRGRPLAVRAGLVLALAATVTLLVRLPGAFSNFSSTASSEKGRNELNGALATADSVAVNDGWVRAAFELVPPRGSFVVALPANQAAAEQQDHVAAITFAALPSMLEDYLLPRRKVQQATPGTFVLCYFCDAGTWNPRTRWLYDDKAGGRVGRVLR